MHNDMKAACETRKPLILAGQGDVSKLTLYATMLPTTWERR
jgi:hypothetical protein